MVRESCQYALYLLSILAFFPYGNIPRIALPQSFSSFCFLLDWDFRCFDEFASATLPCIFFCIVNQAIPRSRERVKLKILWQGFTFFLPVIFVQKFLIFVLTIWLALPLKYIAKCHGNYSSTKCYNIEFFMNFRC